MQIGNPEAIGIMDINKPDYGDSVEIREGEIPVFWACGVTPQAAIENAKLPLVITHAPGHMFITNVLNTELNDFLEAKKTKINTALLNLLNHIRKKSSLQNKRREKGEMFRGGSSPFLCKKLDRICCRR